MNEHGIMEGSTLKLTVVEASELVTSDLTGFGDPFVQIEYLKDDWKTPVMENTSSPKWNHCIMIPISKPQDLVVKAYDYNKWRSNSLIGQANLPLNFF